MISSFDEITLGIYEELVTEAGTGEGCVSPSLVCQLYQRRNDTACSGPGSRVQLVINAKGEFF